MPSGHNLRPPFEIAVGLFNKSVKFFFFNWPSLSDDEITCLDTEAENAAPNQEKSAENVPDKSAKSSDKESGKTVAEKSTAKGDESEKEASKEGEEQSKSTNEGMQ